ncbi:MAG: hypothetical protein JNM90_11730 [Burkholderiales bacterium]|nr:hypothetical protein [Burkholderiales bacterium]
MPRQSKSASHARRAIAAQAARLIAEDGLADYGAAKRKAARQLGFRDSDGLPDNAEIESEVRAYQLLYQNDEQRTRLRELRRVAREVLDDFTAHRPHLTGAAWNGTASRGAGIDIDLFTDDQKMVELSLVNRGVPYTTLERAHFSRLPGRHVPVLRFDREGHEVSLSLYSTADLRSVPRSSPDGRAARGDAMALDALIAGDDGSDATERFLATLR